MPIGIQSQEQQVEAPQKFLVLPQIFVAEMVVNTPTPSVKNITRLKFHNTSAFNVTFFKDGQEGQEIQLLGDDNVTLIHDDVQIRTLAAANLVLLSHKVYTLTYFDGCWIEH